MQLQQSSCFNYLHSRISLLSFLACLYFYCAVLNAAQQASTDKQWLDAQLEIANGKSVQDPGQAAKFLEWLLIEYNPQLNTLQRSELQLVLADNYLLMGNLVKAIALEKQIANHQSLLSNESLIRYYLIKSSIYSFSGQTDRALALLSTAEEQVTQLENEKLKSKVYGALADFYVYNHHDIKALDYFYKSYAIIKHSGDLLDLAYIESSMAKSYEYLFDYEKALEMQQKALDYFLENDLVFDSLVSYFHLAKVYLKMERSQDAIDSSLKMLALADKVANKNLVYYGYIILAEVYLFEKNLAQAEHYLSLSNQYFDRLEDFANIVNHLYVQAGIELAQNLTDQAAKTLTKAQSLTEKIPEESSVISLLKLARLQVELAVQQNDYQLAYKYQQHLIALNEQHYSDVRELSRSQQKVSFDNKQDELEKQLLKKDEELNEFALLEIKQQQALQNTIIFSVLLLFLLLLLFSWRQFRLKRKFKLLANTDYLTGIANRRKVMDFAELQWQQLKKGDQHFCLITFDLDHFKYINDEFGHPAGDRVLKVITETSQCAIRECDFLGRIGGEEFLVVLNNTSRVEAIEIAHRIRSDIEKTPISYGKKTIQVTASFGVAQKKAQLNSFKDLLKNADKALYIAKERGRNRVETDE